MDIDVDVLWRLCHILECVCVCVCVDIDVDVLWRFRELVFSPAAPAWHGPGCVHLYIL